MQQIIRYLYEYENGNRIRNVGFIKVERQMDKCVMNIHGKGLDFGPEKKMKVYVCFVLDGQCIGAEQGAIEMAAPMINYILKFGPEDVGGWEAYDKAAALVLRNLSGRTYAALWTEDTVDIENMRMENEVIRKEPVQEEAVQEVVMQAEAAQEEPVREAVMQAEAAQEEPVREVIMQEETVQKEVRETLIEHVEKLVEEKEILHAAEEVEQYIPPKTRTYEKIQRQDISRLPRKEWRLANNSFLLHGFYNYHHLLYIEEGEHCWIGVPGIYHEKERAAARAFGFPQFHRITDADIELSAEEKNTFDDFGYWCRQVEH